MKTSFCSHRGHQIITLEYFCSDQGPTTYDYLKEGETLWVGPLHPADILLLRPQLADEVLQHSKAGLPLQLVVTGLYLGVRRLKDAELTEHQHWVEMLVGSCMLLTPKATLGDMRDALIACEEVRRGTGDCFSVHMDDDESLWAARGEGAWS